MAIPARPAGPGGDQPDTNPFPTKTAPIPFGKRTGAPPAPGLAKGGLIKGNKGFMGKNESFAAGGPVLGRTRDFMKEPDRFRGGAAPTPEPTEDTFGKGSSGGRNAAPAAKGKSERPIRPR